MRPVSCVVGLVFTSCVKASVKLLLVAYSTTQLVAEPFSAQVRVAVRAVTLPLLTVKLVGAKQAMPVVNGLKATHALLPSVPQLSRTQA